MKQTRNVRARLFWREFHTYFRTHTHPDIERKRERDNEKD